MKVINISLDPAALDINSRVSDRNRLYGEIVSEYRVMVPHTHDTISELTGSVTIYGVGGRNKFIQMLKIFGLIKKLVKEKKCDVIATSDPYFLGITALILARMYHKGFEVQVLGIEKFTALRKILAQLVIHHAGAIRVNSTQLKEKVVKEFNVDERDVLFVPVYVSVGKLGLTSDMTPGHPEWHKREAGKEAFQKEYGKSFNFLTVGRLVEVKNIDMQLRAMKSVIKRNPEVVLHIIGDGRERTHILQMIENLGLGGHVIVHGSKTGVDLGVFYSESDSYLLTAHIEGWPMEVFDAIRAGLPVVMTDVGCAGEVIQNEKNGLIVEFDDEEHLSEAMERMVKDPALRSRLTAAARLHFDNYWTKEQILAGYRQSWDKALSHNI